MNGSRSLRTLATAFLAIALVGVLALMAGGALGRAGDPGASPTPPPNASPTPPPSNEPSKEPSDPNRIPLDIATDHDVVVIIDDLTESVVGAKSGRAGDGMSVRWGDALVENVDERTLRLTWVGLAVDDEVELSISEAAGGLSFEIVQRGPYPNTDATGYDRVLVIEFDEAVNADDVEVSIDYHQD